MKAFLTCILALLALAGCSRGADSAAVAEGDSIIAHASLLRIHPADGYTRVDIYMPSDTARPAWSYALIERGTTPAVPSDLIPVVVPLQRSIVYSTVHTTPMCELHATDAIVAVADPQYFTADDPIYPRIANGSIASIGSSMAPSLEQIIDLEADAILLSPIEGANLGGVERAHIPLIFMADYLEPTPLGRAEWLKLIGRLYGCQQQADSVFAAVAQRYTELKTAAARTDSRPTVITERPFDGVWYVPAGNTYMARMLADAAAVYPWAADPNAGSLPLDEAAVIDRAADADFWLIKDGTTHSPESLLAVMPHAVAFKAFPDRVYSSDGTIFRHIAFHPERVLSDFVTIFHPEIAADSLHFFAPIKP